MWRMGALNQLSEGRRFHPQPQLDCLWVMYRTLTRPNRTLDPCTTFGEDLILVSVSAF